MFNALRHNLVNSGTTLITEFCTLFNMQTMFPDIVNCNTSGPTGDGILLEDNSSFLLAENSDFIITE